MMLKYRVHEVAKDLNVPNKFVLDVLQKYCNETKKHMTALTEEELNLVLESFTQSHKMENLDAYFADNKQDAKEPETARKQEEPKKQPQQNAGASNAGSRKPARGNNGQNQKQK